MAFEPIGIRTYNNNAQGFNNNRQNQLGGNQVDLNKPFDPLKDKDIDDLEKSRREEKTNETDRVNRIRDDLNLSNQALQQLNFENRVSNQRQQQVLSLDFIEQRSIELRGLEQFKSQQQNFTLESEPTDLFKKIDRSINEIKSDLSSIGISEDDSRKIADEVLSKLDYEADSIIDDIQRGVATGEKFEKLNEINNILNKANGLGLEEKLNNDSKVLNNLNDKLNKLLENGRGRILDKNETSLIQNLQKELSFTQGFRYNILDGLGKDGILA